MTKVQALTGQQRLRQLVRRQLGSDVHTESVAKEPSSEANSVHFQQQHALLTARVGIQLPNTTGYSAGTLAERAAQRLQIRRELQQQNLEKVLTLALEYCPEQIKAQDVDPDWFQYFCDLVQDISTQSMQKLWAKILAGEITCPGTFAFKTLNILRQMSYKDAIALQQASSLSCRTRTQEPAHIYFGYVQQGSIWRWLAGRSKGMLNLSQFGLSYPQILNLIDLGLLHQSEIESGELSKNQPFQWYYHQQLIKGTPTRAGVILQYYKFTSVGAELLPLLSSQPNPTYWQALQVLFSDVINFG